MNLQELLNSFNKEQENARKQIKRMEAAHARAEAAARMLNIRKQADMRHAYALQDNNVDPSIIHKANIAQEKIAKINIIFHTVQHWGNKAKELYEAGIYRRKAQNKLSKVEQMLSYVQAEKPLNQRAAGLKGAIVKVLTTEIDRLQDDLSTWDEYIIQRNNALTKARAMVAQALADAKELDPAISSWHTPEDINLKVLSTIKEAILQGKARNMERHAHHSIKVAQILKDKGVRIHASR